LDILKEASLKGLVMVHQMNSFLLRIVYFCVLTPVGMILRAVGYDPLKLNSQKSSSFWSNKKPSQYDANFFHKQG
jgi:ABC-type uncharacterized transport system permease subunit